MLDTSVEIKEPQTQQEFGAYFFLRYELLRKPWGKAIGSEKDEMEEECTHAMAVSTENKMVGVCRLQFNSNLEAQIRYMAVSEDYRGRGVGKLLLNYLEQKAKQKGAEMVILHSRESAVAFYKKCGYQMEGKSYLMWDTIQHYLLHKKI
jgi:N-acetylglutamate synthase-like GNAT family acetyltransferase